MCKLHYFQIDHNLSLGFKVNIWFNLIHIIFLLHVFTNVDTCIVIYDIYMYIYGQMICMKYKGKIEKKKEK